jgi:methionyl-tRNA formyltransferase
MSAFEIYNKVRGFSTWAFCYLKIKNNFLRIGNAQVVDLRENEFFIKNKKYKIPDRYVNAQAGKIISKGDDWLLCSTISEEHAILFYDVCLYGFCKQFLTKSFVSRLKSLKE